MEKDRNRKGIARPAGEKKRHTGGTEKQLLRLFEQHPHPMLVFDRRRLSLVSINSSAVRLYGFTPEECRELKWRLADPSVLPIPGSPEAVSNELIAENTPHRLDVTLHSIRLARRELIVASVSESNVETRARDSYFRSIFENEPACVKLVKADGTILHMNPAGVRLLEAESLQSVLGRNIYSSVLPEHLSAFRQLIERACQGQPGTLEYEMVSRKGNRRWMETYVIPHSALGEAVALAIAHDVTEKKRTQEALQESEERYRRLVELSPEGIAVHSDGIIIFMNKAGARILGEDDASRMIGKPVLDIVHPDFHAVVRKRIRMQMQDGEAVPLMEEKHLRKDGKPIDVEVAAMPFAYGQKRAALVIFHDITQRKRNEAIQTALYRIAEKTNSSKDMQALYSALHGIVAELMYARNFYIALYDSNTELISFPYFRDEFDAAPAPAPLGRGATEYVLRTGKPLLASQDVIKEMTGRGEIELVGPESVDWLGVPLRSGEKTFGVLVVQSYNEKVRYGVRERDVLNFVSQHVASALERKQAEETIYFQAYHDPLTRLPNRMLFQDRFMQALAHASRSNEILAMLFLDLDRFKNVNDTLGHALGDRLLQEVGKRLKDNLREGDTVARLGGDEFMIVVSGVHQMEDVAKIAEKILNVIRPPFHLASQDVRITTSIGISIYPYDGLDVESLIRNADTALYRAKERGRDNHQMYTSTMNQRAMEQLTLENDLRQALDRNEFVVYYQPQIDSRSRSIIGLEALLRWKRPGGKLLLPSGFMRLAEDTGLIVPIGEWVLREACSQNKRWQLQGLPPVPVAVNISVRQFQQPDLTHLISRTLREAGLDPQYLELELTENAIMRNPEVAIDTAYTLKEMGVQLAIDNFGTGFSSLGYLRRFPVGSLKIDPGFTRDQDEGTDSAGIISGILSMARSLKLKVIAEGVETAEQMSFLLAQQCDRMQGYFFSAPLPADDIPALLSGKRPLPA